MLVAGNVVSSVAPAIVPRQVATRLNVAGIGPSPARKTRDVVRPNVERELVTQVIPARKLIDREGSGKTIRVPARTVVRSVPVSAPAPVAAAPIAPTAILDDSYDEDFPYGRTTLRDVVSRQKSSSVARKGSRGVRVSIPCQGTVRSPL